MIVVRECNDSRQSYNYWFDITDIQIRVFVLLTNNEIETLSIEVQACKRKFNERFRVFRKTYQKLKWSGCAVKLITP